jgi:hypothetical protein
MSVVYLVTYPNGKVFVGRDRSENIAYFGSPDPQVIAEDFTHAERQRFTVTREILWESKLADRFEATAVEVEMIDRYRANDPAVGYNRWPLFVPEA